MLAALIRKEIIALLRDVHGLAALFVMPVLFIVVMSLALRDLYSAPERSLRYAIADQDGGDLARSLRRAWQADHGAPEPLPADWPQALQGGRLKYVLVLAVGLSAELAAPKLPTAARIRLLAEPGADANLLNALRAQIGATAGEVKARAALAAMGAPAPPAGASTLALVQVERFASHGPRPSAVQQNVPAWLVFGMFFVVASSASLLVQERSTGTLARLFSLGVPRRTVLLAKALPYFGVNAVQAALMIAVGVWVMPLLGGEALTLAGINWPALVVVLAAIGLAAVGMSLALACTVRSHAQAAAIGPIINVLLAAVGGIMVPKFVMPAFMQRLAELSPMNWGLEALLDVLVRSGGLASTLPEVLRLVGFAVAMFAFALLMLGRTSR